MYDLNVGFRVKLAFETIYKEFSKLRVVDGRLDIGLVP